MHHTNLRKGTIMTDPSQKIQIGDKATIQKEVTFDTTIASFKADLPPVFATPSMIMLMETTAAKAIKDALPDGWISVGTSVNIKHLAPTPVGSMVTSTATVIAVDGVVVTFEVSVQDATEIAGSGTHQRALVEVARFMRRVQKKKAANS
jgi:predicted thioesterase